MTSAARIRGKAAVARGFTLLEIVIVMLVIALIGGGAMGMMVLSRDERVLSDASGEVGLLAKRARTLAALQQRPYALEFHENRVTLMPLAEAVLEPGQREAAAAAFQAGQENAPEGQANRFSSVHATWEAGEEMQVFIRRWASDTWVPVSAENREVWRFDVEGTCEPVGVRFQLGKSWEEAEFHPLTASVRDTSKEIY
jgi:prepilin-type N-terminal cleavage/methylation domain-containing protein